jgi:predicted GNAT family acetyltransferase
MSDDLRNVVVRDEPARSRYELVVDGELIGIADYRIEGDEVIFPHTEIDPAHRGKGLGEVLVRGAMEHVRTTGRTVVPRCWFVVEFLELHPEFADLRAA